MQEIISLEGNDIRLVDDIWCIRVEKAKTRASERTVPLHPAIIRQGFLDHVQAQGSGRLFGEKAASNGALVKRLRRWLHGIEGVELGREHDIDPNHGWRHWFKTVAREVAAGADATAAFTRAMDRSSRK